MRALRLVCIAAIAVALIGPGRVAAQGLRSLHLDSLTMRADRSHVDVGEDLHLTIHAHVRERISALDELVIPDVGTMHVLGDERRATRAAGGTDIDEVLTLEPVEAGAFTIPGATLDAIDGRTGKATRFTANSVRVSVGATTSPSYWITIQRSALFAALLLVYFVALTAIVIWGVLKLGGKTGRTIAPRSAPVPTSDPICVLPPRPSDAVRSALAAFRAAPTPEQMAVLRVALFHAAGVDEGATLRDATDATDDSLLMVALRAVDAATFAPRTQWPAHASAATDAVEAWLA